MSDIAIRVVDLSKQYRIGGKQERYRTLRETLADAAVAPFRRVRSILRGHGAGLADSDRTIWALKEVSFEVKPGEVVGIIGRNGAGKSTLLKILSRITDPTEGYAEVHGRVGSLLEVGTGFHPELTGRENIYLNGAILGMKRAEIERKFDEIVAFAEVEKFIDTPVKHYSSGMYLRLAFAVAAHLEPEILLVDEVLAVGDATFQRRCLGKMTHIARQGRTVLFVSHNLAAISNLCPSTLLLSAGRLTCHAETSTAIAEYLKTLTQATRPGLRFRADRSGTGQARLTGINILSDNGDCAGTIQCGAPATFELEYDSVSSELRNLDFEIKICDSSEVLLLTFSTYLLAKPFACLPPKGRVCCYVPAFPLAPGSYSVLAAIIQQGTIVDVVHHATELTILLGDFYQSGKVPKRHVHGPFLVPHSWRAT